MADTTPIENDPALQKHFANIDSKATCMGPQCRRKIKPEKLFCCDGCMKKTRRKGNNELSRVHKEALKVFEPNRIYEQARVVDGGLWHDREDPETYKYQQHKLEWFKTFGNMFSRYITVGPNGKMQIKKA